MGNKVPFELMNADASLLDQIEALTQAVTDGPWELAWRTKEDGGETYCVASQGAVVPDVAFTNRYERGYHNAKYISLLDPETVLALVRVARWSKELMEMIEAGDEIELNDYNDNANTLMTNLRTVADWVVGR